MIIYEIRYKPKDCKYPKKHKYKPELRWFFSQYKLLYNRIHSIIMHINRCYPYCGNKYIWNKQPFYLISDKRQVFLISSPFKFDMVKQISRYQYKCS